MRESNQRHSAAGSVAMDDTSANMVVRRCVMCGQWKPQSEFHNSRTGQFSYCRGCRRAYDRRYYHEGGKDARNARNKKRMRAARAWMTSLKAGVACADCGQTFPAYVMHWDHLPGFEKIESISVLVGRFPRTLVLEELKKCELVCANCHVLRTIRRAGRSAAW